MATTLYNGTTSLNVQSNNGDKIYNFRLQVLLNSVNEDTKKANITINMYWHASPSYFANYSYAFNVSDYEVWISLYDSTTGATKQVGRKKQPICYKTEKLATSWTGDIDYNEEGILFIKANCGCSTKSTGYMPKASSASGINTGNLYLPQLELAPEMYVQVNGAKKKVIKSFIQVNGALKQIKKMFIQVDGALKSIK